MSISSGVGSAMVVYVVSNNDSVIEVWINSHWNMQAVDHLDIDGWADNFVV